MFNTQRILDIMSFNLPQEVSLQGKLVPPGRITIFRDHKTYKFVRYESNENGFFNPVNYGFMPVSEAGLFFQKIFKIDLIEESDVNI